MDSDKESIYQRVGQLEDETAGLISEMDIIKKAARNNIVRYEIDLVKKGNDVISIID